jgi:hypothetical protein
MRFFKRLSPLALCLAVTGSMMGSQDAPSSKATARSLTNADVVDLVHSGLTQEIILTKMEKSSCDFDTSPVALKALKTADIPDAVILAMVKASGRSAEPVQESHLGVEATKKSTPSEKQTDEKKREEIQKLDNDLDDCRLRAQNEYEKKMNLASTLALTPVQRVYASSRLKQNLDSELKTCRSQYQSRRNALEGK